MTSLNQRFAYAFGAVYLLVGVIGFVVTGFSEFAEINTNDKLLMFELNPLHNIIHLLIGGMLFTGATGGFKTARNVNMIVGGGYLAVGIVGMFIANNTSDMNILSLNAADNILHLGTALLALGIAMSERTETAGTTMGSTRTA